MSGFNFAQGPQYWQVLMHMPVQDEIGKGSFQELDQLAAVRPFCKLTVQATSPDKIAAALKQVHQAWPPLHRA